MKSTLTLLMVFCASFALLAQSPTGELKRWHKITLSFEGPNSSESANPNPFTDYRLDVTFTNGSSTFTVPGYYAGCADAQDSGCTEGNVWRVHFSPGKTGTWNWTASFKQGDDIAIKSGGASAGFMDGNSGSFDIAESDKSGRDFRAKDKGRLQYVGEHYLRFSGTDPDNPNGDWFVKAGADSPENAFNYVDFDATPSYNNNLNKIGSKTWAPHQQDYDAGDASAYTWDNGKGTEILGMINYLSTEGANVISFLTWNTSGDGGAVFPHTLKVSLNEYGNTGRGQQWSKVNKDRFDVSKLAQWEKVMEYADKKGMYLHFKTMETENDNLMDGDNFGRERKIYYREIISRFGHHLALNWNMTEETTLKDAVAKATAQYIKDVDPYDHNIVLHTYPPQKDQRYDPLLGDKSQLTGASLQTNKPAVHNDVVKWINKSRNAGKKWVVANDEQGGAGEGIRVSDKRVRDEVLWGTLMAGGAGVEYYSGYTDDDGDINGNDHRKRGNKYKEGGYALSFFNNHLQPYMVDMVSSDGVTSDGNDYVFAKAGEVYAVYRPNGGTTGINLPSGSWQVQWFNPRSGGALSTAQAITNSLSAPDNNDWVALIKGESDGGPDPDCDSLSSNAAHDAYLQGSTRFNDDELRVEEGNRVSYLQFEIPSTDKEVTAIKLRLTVNEDPGNGTIDIYKGSSNNWTEGNLSDGNKPSEGAKIGSISGSFNQGQRYEWNLSGVAQGERVSLVVKHSGSDDVSFFSAEASNGPQILVETECEDTGDCTAVNLVAISDFPNINVSGFSPAYKDNDRNALAIDAAIYKDEFAAAEVAFAGETGTYNITLNTLRELDGESTYRVVVDGELVGTFQNPETDTDYAPASTEFQNVSVAKGDMIRVEFNSHTNGKIPEGDGTAFARGRWTSLAFVCVGGDPDPDPDPDPDNCVPTEQNGVVAVEAEHFVSQRKDGNRKWYILDGTTSGPTPDPDPSHHNGASGGAYLEILPDTRVTHDDPLGSGVSFSNTPGETTIVDYKVKFNSPGRYFVWVRAYSTGSEDNGVHVGINGTWPSSGARLQWCTNKNSWRWESKQRREPKENHCGVEREIYLDIPSAGVHTISFSLREDGFEMDKFVMSKEYSRPNGAGPDEFLTDCTLSVGDLDNPLQHMYVTPVPANNAISLNGFTGDATVTIYDMFGKKLLSDVPVDGANNSINVQQFPEGMYLMAVYSKGAKQTLKFLKRH